ncbi:MAG: aminofutalosine synthase MqnE [Bacteroidetes bacterium CG2_30_32_10]|nr:MAG: aminofutalosine synthase MqnE [Bacteroidetes bacterium CG2_30_32_10]
MKKEIIERTLQKSNISEEIKIISKKILNFQRITPNEGLILYIKGELGFLGMLANYVKENINKQLVYYNQNLHIEPTNICLYKCKFCSYSSKNNEDAWELSEQQIIKKIKKHFNNQITEIHIVGGVHPDRDLHYYGNIIKKIKQLFPTIHIKAFTAVEIDYMSKKSGLSLLDGLNALKSYGLDSIPGGGAEILDDQIRKQICGAKSNSKTWLLVHETAHQLGIPSNATMLYGHIEHYKHRIAHLNLLRELQDKTTGFNAFIPLKFRNKRNELAGINEVSVIEDLKNYAVCRIFFDNIPHIKAYWPMIGKETAQISLSFGVDDLDGTINDSTKIYSKAGADDINPMMDKNEMINFIKNANRIPVERDSLYNIINKLS